MFHTVSLKTIDFFPKPYIFMVKWSNLGFLIYSQIQDVDFSTFLSIRLRLRRYCYLSVSKCDQSQSFLPSG